MVVKSIQGEREARKRKLVWASDSAVQSWVEEAQVSDPWKLACKSRGRHNFPAQAEAGLTFCGITKDGLWVRRLGCRDCHAPDEPVKVERVELWDVRHSHGKITRAVIVTADLDYVDPSYLQDHGQGRTKPRQIQTAQATAALRGQGYRDFRKAVILVSAPQADEDTEIETA